MGRCFIITGVEKKKRHPIGFTDSCRIYLVDMLSTVEYHELR
jgi:hypothetical protein